MTAETTEATETAEPDRPLVIMGVQGTGKTTIGVALASRLHRTFLDADDLHPAANLEKMSGGAPLDDEDRLPWLKRVGEEIRTRSAAGPGPVVACSALKRWYRELLRSESPRIRFVHLTGDPELIAQRVDAREHAFMPTSLLASQLRTLEPPAPWEDVIEVDVADTPDRIVDEIVSRLDTAQEEGGP